MFSRDTTRLLRAREESEGVNRRLQNKLQVSRQLVDRLGLDVELEGHQGCVNCLEWSTNGCLLASGSDDLHAIIWDPFKQRIKQKINTGHSGNIFSVKFMPNSGDHVLATAAGDSQIRVHSLSANDTIHVFKCHSSRVKRLATSADVPHMIWSSSEDGTVRQFDLRESHACSTSNEDCKNTLVDLRVHVGSYCEAKCIEVNPCQSELLAVGCNDPYARLFDRRMLARHCTSSSGGSLHCSRLTCRVSSESASLPNGCVRYFSPGQLSRISRRRKGRVRSVVSTYVTFSGDGRELLVNLGGEHLYLFDIHRPTPPLWYASFRNETPNVQTRNGFKHHESADVVTKSEDERGGKGGRCVTLRKSKPSGNTNGYNVPKATPKDPPGCAGTVKTSGTSYHLPAIALELKMRANQEYEKRNYWAAVNLYDEALRVAPGAAVLYANRAAALLKRSWYGDVYAALRDCNKALVIDPSSSKAAYRQARCLYELKWLEEADACFKRFTTCFPDERQTKLVKCLERDIKAAIFSETEDDDNDTKTNNDSSSSRNFTDSVNLGNSRMRNVWLETDPEFKLRKTSHDYKTRFCGHCNTTTDIKEANFLGADGEYVAAGSDNGSFFIWEKSTTNLLKILKGDDSIVNCIQPHPYSCLLATSGIDPVVRLWSAQAENGERPGDERRVPDDEFAHVVKDNQRRMKTGPFEAMLLNFGYATTRDGGGSDDSEEEPRMQCHAS